MKHAKAYIAYYFIFTLSFCCLFFGTGTPVPSTKAARKSNTDPVFVFLSCHNVALQIGEQYQLTGFTTNGKLPRFKSSNSKIASVNSCGLVTGKKGGTARITAFIGASAASCQVTVEKTVITTEPKQVTLERGESIQLKASVSNGSKVHWKSNKKATAYINENGLLTAGRPGEAIITAKADQSETKIYVTVKKPEIYLKQAAYKLYRGQSFQLETEVSSGILPKFRSSKKSVAVVDKTGKVTAIKHGTALITVTADGVSSTCEITVKVPDISLNTYDLTLKEGEARLLLAKVSSGNTPSFKSSNPDIVTVTQTGIVMAHRKGKAYIYASEDGAKERCVVKVTE